VRLVEHGAVRLKFILRMYVFLFDFLSTRAAVPWMADEGRVGVETNAVILITLHQLSMLNAFYVLWILYTHGQYTSERGVPVAISMALAFCNWYIFWTKGKSYKDRLRSYADSTTKDRITFFSVIVLSLLVSQATFWIWLGSNSNSLQHIH